jgi:hypothetical protein
MLERLDPDGTTPAELLIVDGASGQIRLCVPRRFAEGRKCLAGVSG